MKKSLAIFILTCILAFMVLVSGCRLFPQTERIEINGYTQTPFTVFGTGVNVYQDIVLSAPIYEDDKILFMYASYWARNVDPQPYYQEGRVSIGFVDQWGTGRALKTIRIQEAKMYNPILYDENSLYGPYDFIFQGPRLGLYATSGDTFEITSFKLTIIIERQV